jgi:hypothetical protein
MITKGVKLSMSYSPTLEAEVHAINKDVVDIILWPSDGNAWWVKWSLKDIEAKVKSGMYKIKDKEISFGI